MNRVLKTCLSLAWDDIAFTVRKRDIIDVEKLNQQKFKCTTQGGKPL